MDGKSCEKGGKMMKQERKMMKICGLMLIALVLVIASTIVMQFQPAPAIAAKSMAGVDEDAQAALRKLYASDPSAKVIAGKAKAILVFPDIVKAGFIGGAQYGEGVLIKNGQSAGHYNIMAASYGLQAGVQSFGYAMFLMTDDAIQYLDQSAGWEVGVGPSIVVVKKGMGRSLTTTTLKKDVYAFVFNQKGLMAGGGLQGSKITRVSP
jgi:lipid-binding SYLF domain-containing protein